MAGLQVCRFAGLQVYSFIHFFKIRPRVEKRIHRYGTVPYVPYCTAVLYVRCRTRSLSAERGTSQRRATQPAHSHVRTVPILGSGSPARSTFLTGGIWSPGRGSVQSGPDLGPDQTGSARTGPDRRVTKILRCAGGAGDPRETGAKLSTYCTGTVHQ